MKKFDVEIKRSVSGSDPLPVGGYVAKIMNAEVKEYSWGDVLVVSFDIAEGEYKDFFANQYKANTNEDKKWKGNFRITVPNEGDQYFEDNKKRFGNSIACIEESNPNYHWDWDENKLKGKLVGVLYRNYEYSVTDSKGKTNTGWSTECGTFVSVDDIRKGNFRQMKDRPLKNKPVETKPVFEQVVSDEDLPF